MGDGDRPPKRKWPDLISHTHVSQIFMKAVARSFIMNLCALPPGKISCASNICFFFVSFSAFVSQTEIKLLKIGIQGLHTSI